VVGTIVHAVLFKPKSHTSVWELFSFVSSEHTVHFVSANRPVVCYRQDKEVTTKNSSFSSSLGFVAMIPSVWLVENKYSSDVVAETGHCHPIIVVVAVLEVIY
jgi:hypothetical protein